VKISNEFKIGLMAIIVVAFSVWGYKFLRGRNLLKPTNNYFVSYQNIDALASTSPVFIRGMNVGTVSKVELAEDMQTITATLDIKRGIRIPKDAEAVIISTGLMGGKAVDLKIKGACSGPDCAEPGSFLKGSVKGFFDTFLDKGEEGTLAKVKETISEVLTTFTPDQQPGFYHRYPGQIHGHV
jgi:phospholipid/cholesterol/gamma-HCH transport system substrate-binding protein